MLTPNILFFQDASVYTGSDEERDDINSVAKDSLIICRRNICKARPILEYLQVPGPWDFHKSLLKLHGCVTSTPLAFQIMVNLGFNPIIFCGVDCNSKGENFFGPTDKHKDSFIDRTTEGLKWCESQAVRLKKELICCSDNGILPYTPIGDVMAKLEDCEQDREFYMDKLRIDK